MRGAQPQSDRERPSWSNRWSERELSALRRAYFSRLTRPDTATRRFGVDVDRVVEQIVGARRCRSALSRRPEMLHLDDAALAAACVDLDGAAWAHLIDLHEPGLVAAVELHIDQRGSLVAVRQLLSVLRNEGRLRQYGADTPLQSWLIEQLMDALGVSGIAPRRQTPMGVDARTKLAMRLLGESRGAVRRSSGASDQGADRTGS
ncbi:MAG: hypothetical protein H6814_11625 [Phycisphaeraceae bacterium]|nr:hypothetical protein [Phycisphaeraceae bacterium]